MQDSNIPTIKSKVIRVVAAAVGMTSFLFISSRLEKPAQTYRQYILSLTCLGAVQKKFIDPQSRYMPTIFVDNYKYHPYNSDL